MKTKKARIYVDVPSMEAGKVWVAISGRREDIISLFHSTYASQMPEKLRWTKDEVFTLEYEFCKTGIFRAIKDSEIPF